MEKRRVLFSEDSMGIMMTMRWSSSPEGVWQARIDLNWIGENLMMQTHPRVELQLSTEFDPVVCVDTVREEDGTEHNAQDQGGHFDSKTAEAS